MLDCPVYLQVLGYKLGYQRSNSLYPYCQDEKAVSLQAS